MVICKVEGFKKNFGIFCILLLFIDLFGLLVWGFFCFI